MNEIQGIEILEIGIPGTESHEIEIHAIENRVTEIPETEIQETEIDKPEATDVEVAREMTEIEVPSAMKADAGPLVVHTTMEAVLEMVDDFKSAELAAVPTFKIF